MQQTVFGALTSKESASFSEKYYSNNRSEIDYIFRNASKQMEHFSVVEVECAMALNKLRLLTQRLQSNRIKQNAKVFCKYFSD